MAGGRGRSLWWCCCFDILVHLIESIAAAGGGGGGRKSRKSISCGCIDDLVLGEDVLIEDILFQILARLPVKSLLRFKTVCKSWCTLIERPDFIDHHISTFGSSNSFGSFILQCQGAAFYMEPNFLYLTGDGDDNELPVFEDLGIVPYFRFAPYNGHDAGRISMVGSCNGIVCIHDVVQRVIGLWNPATKQFRLVPKSLPLPDDYNSGIRRTDFVAFGFDIERKDYKVLQVTSWSPGDIEYPPRRDYKHLHYEERFFPHSIWRVQVYSLRNDSWRYIEDADLPCYCQSAYDIMRHIVFYGHEQNQGRYFNGNYLLMGRKWAKNAFIAPRRNDVFVWVILSFDFTKEKFSTIKPPLSCDVSPLSNLSLDLIGEKVAIIAWSPYNTNICMVWVLNNYNSKNEECCNWNHLYTINLSIYKGVPVAFPKNGKITLLMRDRTHSYYLITFENEEYVINERLWRSDVCQVDRILLRADVYKPSLVSIK